MHRPSPAEPPHKASWRPHSEDAAARCEIGTFRYRALHVAARITRGARQTRLRIDKHWRWATHIARGFHRIRAAFA